MKANEQCVPVKFLAFSGSWSGERRRGETASTKSKYLFGQALSRIPKPLPFYTENDTPFHMSTVEPLRFELFVGFVRDILKGSFKYLNNSFPYAFVYFTS